MRLLGVGVSGFASPNQNQPLLFDEEEHAAHASLDQAADRIRDKFGTSSLNRASGMLFQTKHDRESRSGDSDQYGD